MNDSQTEGVSKVLRSIAEGILLIANGVETDGKPVSAKTRETKVTRAPKTKAKAAADDELLEDDADTEGLADDLNESVDEDTDSLDEDLEESDDEEISKTQVLAAFKDFINKKKIKGKIDKVLNRKEAIKVLKSVKAKSVDEIKPKDFSKVIEQLEV